MTKRRWVFITALALGALVVTAGVVVARGPGSPSGAPLAQSAVGTGFTYQGRLDEGGTPANGAFDLKFVLFDADVGGSQVGGIVAMEDVAVANGLFTVRLHFGDGVFTGDARWLEVAVRPGASVNAHAIMSPRQPLTPTPYALALPGFYTQPNDTSPNVIGGFRGNLVSSGAAGATVSGGGISFLPNRVSGSFATVGGGKGNEALAEAATIGGGGAVDVDRGAGPVETFNGNRVFDLGGTVGGGSGNLAGSDNGDTLDARFSTVGGGSNNTASGLSATVGGGSGNTASQRAATISGGEGNSASGGWATVAGGLLNQASGARATIPGGDRNTADGFAATIGGGQDNAAPSFHTTVGGGQGNNASGDTSTISGGNGNVASGILSTVGGGKGNQALAEVATIGGGGAVNIDFGPVVVTFNGNRATDIGSTVGGGSGNLAGSDNGDTLNARFSTVGGGSNNTASARAATVGGGEGNTAAFPFATVSGGLNNSAVIEATVGGGVNNRADDGSATVGGGRNNVASGERSTVGGGFFNTASNVDDTVGGGQGNVASGGWATVGGGLLNKANGTRATIPGGDRNTADGHYSFAAGRRANADHQGSFVWADSNDFDFNSTITNEFAVRATGGVRFVTGIDGITGAPTTGMRIAPDGKVGIGTMDPDAKLDVRGNAFLGPGTNQAAFGAVTIRGPDNVDAILGVHSPFLGVLQVGWDASESRGTISVDSGQDIAFITDATGNSGDPWAGTIPKMVIKGDGNVGIGTTNPTEQLEITGNFNLPATTATEGIIKSGGDLFIHSFGTDNFFAGRNAGNLTMIGGVANANTGVGVNALTSNIEGDSNTAVGQNALLFNITGNGNTAVGWNALPSNSTGDFNTALGPAALLFNTTGDSNTAVGQNALVSNTTGSGNTALGFGADVNLGPFGFPIDNATAIGARARVDASNKIRLGDTNVTVIEGQVSFTASSDANLKENFLAVNGEEVLEKIREFNLQSWNFKGHDPSQFRHYGPTAQEFYAAFGKDDIGAIGTDTTINSGDMDGILMTAIQALEERTADLEALSAKNEEQQRQIEQLKAQVGGRASLAQNADSSGTSVVVLAGGIAGGFMVLAILLGWYVLVRSGRTQTSRRDTA